MNEPVYIVPEKVAIRPIETFQNALELIKDQYWLFLGMSFLGMMIGGMTMYILLGPMICGITLALIRKRNGEQAVFDQLWKGMDYMGEAIIPSVILLVGYIVSYVLFYVLFFGIILVMIPLTANSGGGAEAATASIIGFILMSLVTFLYVAVIMLMVLPFFFAFNLIAERGYKGMPALGLGFRGMWKNVGGLAGFQIVYTLLTMVGMLACCIGHIFLLPVYLAAIHLVYLKIFPPLEQVEPPPLQA